MCPALPAEALAKVGALSPLDQIDFVIEMVEKMIFKHMIRSNCLNFKTDFIFKIPFSVYREEPFFEV